VGESRGLDVSESPTIKWAGWRGQMARVSNMAISGETTRVFTSPVAEVGCRWFNGSEVSAENGRHPIALLDSFARLFFANRVGDKP
jgi:hypothetical protein